MDFFAKAKLKHGDRYDYSEVEYINNTTKVCIICREHGKFFQAPVKHVRGQNCPKCAKNKKLTTAEFIDKAIFIHGSFYDYSQVSYRNIDAKIDIICPHHGLFSQIPYDHLQGHGCIKCGNHNLTQEEFIAMAINKYGEFYDYSLVDYKNKKTAVTIICRKHGQFQQTPLKHLHPTARGCTFCAHDQNRSNTGEFIESAVAVHGEFYDYSHVNYWRALENVEIVCPIHGPFLQRPNDHLNDHGCPSCQVVISSGHNDLISLLPKNIKIESNARNVIPPYEIDVWLPEYGLGIEYHGYYWHGVNKRTFPNRARLRTRHWVKANQAFQNNIKLFQIYDFEFERNPKLIMSMILHKMGHSTRISARKCSVVFECPSQFYRLNHIQGHREAKHHVALVSDGEIVASMSFVSHAAYDFEIIRYCNKVGYGVMGGFSKCLAAFCRRFKPKSIVSFSDRRFSNGDVYYKNGFVKAGTSKPNYKYCKGKLVLSRNKCQKSKLASLLGDAYDQQMSESENMISNGFTQLFDAGNDKWVIKF